MEAVSSFTSEIFSMVDQKVILQFDLSVTVVFTATVTILL